jgi:hypothetical protein
MGDGAKFAAIVVVGVLALGQCKEDPITAAKVAGGGAAVGAGVAAGGALGAAAGGAAKGLGKRAEDKISGRNRPSPRPAPNGPSRPSPATTIPMGQVTSTTSEFESDFDLCVAMAGLPGCVVTK